MTPLLQRIEKVDLAELLKLPWESMLITYEEPHVERLWRPYEDGRIFLHRIHPCKGEALWHPHIWESASKIMKGKYTHKIGIGNVVQTNRLESGSSWEMSDPRLWHSVTPEEITWTIMVTGKKYKTPILFPLPTTKQGILSPSAYKSIIQDFQEFI